MATEYKYHGSSVPGSAAGRVILEGSVSEPKRFVDPGHTIELSDEELESLKGRGLKFIKVSDGDAQEGGSQAGADSRDQQQDDQANSTGENPDDNAGDKSTTPGPRGRQGR